MDVHSCLSIESSDGKSQGNIGISTTDAHSNSQGNSSSETDAHSNSQGNISSSETDDFCSLSLYGLSIDDKPVIHCLTTIQSIKRETKQLVTDKAMEILTSHGPFLRFHSMFSFIQLTIANGITMDDKQHALIELIDSLPLDASNDSKETIIISLIEEFMWPLKGMSVEMIRRAAKEGILEHHCDYCDYKEGIREKNKDQESLGDYSSEEKLELRPIEMALNMLCMLLKRSGDDKASLQARINGYKKNDGLTVRDQLITSLMILLLLHAKCDSVSHPVSHPVSNTASHPLSNSVYDQCYNSVVHDFYSSV